MAKRNHTILVRATVQSTRQLQAMADDPDTPAHMLVYLESIMETLHRGMLGQSMVDEKVTIGMADGLPMVLRKTDYVTVELVVDTQGVKVKHETDIEKDG